MANHGFRKFFETNTFKAGMDPMYIRRLMGQRSGLEDSYLKLSEEGLLEGDSRYIGYIGIIDQLTIEETQKLRREVQLLKVQKNEMEALRNEIDKIKALMNDEQNGDKRAKLCVKFLSRGSYVCNLDSFLGLPSQSYNNFV